MAKIEWTEQNKKAFESAVKIVGDSENNDVVKYAEYILNGMEFGDTDRLLDRAKEGFGKYGVDFDWSPARYSSATLNTQVSEMENLIKSCFDVSAYDASTTKGKKLLSTNTKTKKDGTKDKPVPLTGTQIRDILLKKLHSAAKTEDKK